MSDQPGRVEDFTKPFLSVAFVLLFMGMFTVWAIYGYLVALLLGLSVHVAIDLLPRRS